MYDYISVAETIALIVGILLFAFMKSSRPKNTVLYGYFKFGYGAIMIMLIIEHVVGLYLAFSDSIKQPNMVILGIVGFVYLGMYVIVMYSVSVYLNRLSSRGIKYSITARIVFLSILILYSFAGGYFIYNGKLLGTFGDNGFSGNKVFQYTAVLGMIVVLVTFVIAVINRKYYPRLTFNYIKYGVPYIFIMELVQFLTPNEMCTTFCIMLPLFIAFFTFHSNPMDEHTGCQNRTSFETTIDLFKKEGLQIIYISIPMLEATDVSRLVRRNDIIVRDFYDICRRIEHIDKHSFLYTLGYGEFAIVLRKHSGNLNERAEKIRKELADSKKKINSNLSIHAYHIRHVDNCLNSEDIFDFMNYIVDNSKESDTDTWTVVSDDIYSGYDEFRRIRDALAVASERHDLQDKNILCYVQPIFDTKTGTFKSAEALMRFMLDGEMVYPNTLIPIAEKTGYISFLTEVILNKVCEKVYEFKTVYGLDAITVNISASELSDEFFADKVIRIIDMNNVDYSMIRLEITEGGMFERFEIVMENLKRLNAKGIVFYLDDYGTGYSNLERVFECPVKTIKFDKSLLYKAMSDKDIEDIFVSTIKTFKLKGMDVLIEGVEDERQVEFSIKHGFEAIQGYYYSKPLPIEEFNVFLSGRK